MIDAVPLIMDQLFSFLRQIQLLAPELGRLESILVTTSKLNKASLSRNFSKTEGDSCQQLLASAARNLFEGLSSFESSALCQRYCKVHFACALNCLYYEVEIIFETTA